MSIQLQKPSQLLSRVKIDRCSDWMLLKFDRSLQCRQETLLTKQEESALSLEEEAELGAIQELATIFNYLNHQIAHQRRNCLR